MCLIGVALNVHPDYPFILAANRDEFYKRPAKKIHFWDEDLFVLGGKDIEKGGSWLAMSITGRLAALTNVRNPNALNGQPLYSRGELISSYFLNSSRFEKLINSGASFDGYNLLYGHIASLVYTTNQSATEETIEKGIHTLSNASLNTEWPKSLQLKKGLENAISYSYNDGQLTDYLLQILSQSDPFPDHILPDTGVGPDLEKRLSPVFINMQEYGTRSSTVILVDRKGRVSFTELSYVPETKRLSYHFKIR